jgi:hypothetical protein
MTPAQTALLVLLAIFAVLSCLPFVLGFITGLLEKRLVWPYVAGDHHGAKPRLDPIDPYAAPGRGEPLEITEYAIAVNEQVERLGFGPHGHFFDGKGKIYKLRYDFWLAPDRMVLAMVGGGTLAGIPLQATWLYTRLEDGRCLVTIDDPKAGDSDPTGQTLQEVLANADFTELMGRHRQRIEESDSPPLLYSEADPLADHRAFREARAAVLVDQGWAAYLDPQDNWYKYTVKGACLAAFRATLRERKRAISQADRLRIRRPGQEGYLPSELRSSPTPRWIERLQFVCWILLMMGVLTSFSRGPARNSAQLAFRILVPTLGLGGLIVLSLLKLVLKKSTRPGERPLSALATRVPAQPTARGRR